MHLRALGLAIAFVITMTHPGVWAGTIESQTLGKSPNGTIQVPEEVVIILDQDLNDHLQKAREHFTQKDLPAAAADLRKAAALLKLEAGSGLTPEDKELLQTSAQELDRLAAEVQEEAPIAGTELNHAIARAHYGSARHYYRQAMEDRTKRASAQAGHDLRAAVDHVQQGLASAGVTLTAATRAALDEARLLAGKMIAETGFVLNRSGEGYQAVGQALEGLGKQLEQAPAH
jgi:hypothetical protein